MTSVEPHEFGPLPGAGRLCRYCFSPEDEHPTQGWDPARDYGNYADRAGDPRRTRWGYRCHLARVWLSNALDWLP